MIRYLCLKPESALGRQKKPNKTKCRTLIKFIFYFNIKFPASSTAVTSGGGGRKQYKDE
jgi:hypothetical protein